MLTKFDAQLNKILLNQKKFFELHAELLPHIGDDYERFKILIIGESHYLPENFADKTQYFADWYEKSTDEIGGLLNGVTNNWAEAIGWFTTRDANSFPRRVSNYFFEVMREFNLVDDESFDILDYVAFFNYYQRPNLLTAKGFQTIFNDDRESRNACEIAKQIIDVIRPNLILVLAKGCSDSLRKNYGAPLPENIKCFSYPSFGRLNVSEFKKTLRNFFQSLNISPTFSTIPQKINSKTFKTLAEVRQNISGRFWNTADSVIDEIKVEKNFVTHDKNHDWILFDGISNLNLTLYENLENFTLPITAEVGVKNYWYNENLFKKLLNNSTALHNLERIYHGCKFARYVRLNHKSQNVYFEIEIYDSLEEYLNAATSAGVVRRDVSKQVCIDDLKNLGVLENAGNMQKLQRYNFSKYFWLEYLRILEPPVDMIPLCSKDNIRATKDLKSAIERHVYGALFIDTTAQL